MVPRLLRKHWLDIVLGIGFAGALYGIATWYNPDTTCPENSALRYQPETYVGERYVVYKGQPVCVHRDDVDAFDRMYPR